MRYPEPLCARACPTAWRWVVGFATMLVSCSWAEEAPAAATSGAMPRQAVIRTAFRYDPSFRQRLLAEQAVDGEVVRMEQVVVTESKAKLQFTRYMDRKRRMDEANRPSLTRGGDIPGVPGLSVKPHTDILAADARFKASNPDVFRFALFSTAW